MHLALGLTLIQGASLRFCGISTHSVTTTSLLSDQVSVSCEFFLTVLREWSIFLTLIMCVRPNCPAAKYEQNSLMRSAMRALKARAKQANSDDKLSKTSLQDSERCQTALCPIQCRHLNVSYYLHSHTLSPGQTVLPTQANLSQVTEIKILHRRPWLNDTAKSSQLARNRSVVLIRPRSHITITKQLFESWLELAEGSVAKRWKTWLKLGEHLNLIKFKPTRSN